MNKQIERYTNKQSNVVHHKKRALHSLYEMLNTAWSTANLSHWKSNSLVSKHLCLGFYLNTSFYFVDCDAHQVSLH